MPYFSGGSWRDLLRCCRNVLPRSSVQPARVRVWSLNIVVRCPAADLHARQVSDLISPRSVSMHPSFFESHHSGINTAFLLLLLLHPLGVSLPDRVVSKTTATVVKYSKREKKHFHSPTWQTECETILNVDFCAVRPQFVWRRGLIRRDIQLRWQKILCNGVAPPLTVTEVHFRVNEFCCEFVVLTLRRSTWWQQDAPCRYFGTLVTGDITSWTALRFAIRSARPGWTLLHSVFYRCYILITEFQNYSLVDLLLEKCCKVIDAF